MNDPWLQLLLVVGIGICIGAVLGVVLRMWKPEWCKRYALFSMNRKWWLFLASFVLFAALAVQRFTAGNIPFGVFFSLFALLELVAFAFYGFKRVTPDMKIRIEQSDPTKFFSQKPREEG